MTKTILFFLACLFLVACQPTLTPLAAPTATASSPVPSATGTSLPETRTPMPAVPTLTPTLALDANTEIEPENVTQLRTLEILEYPYPIRDGLDVAFSPNSHRLASAHCLVSDTSESDCPAGVIILWDVIQATMVTALEVKGEYQTAVAFSP